MLGAAGTSMLAGCSITCCSTGMSRRTAARCSRRSWATTARSATGRPSARAARAGTSSGGPSRRYRRSRRLRCCPCTSPNAQRQPRSARSGSHDDPRPSQQRPKELSMATVAIPAVETKDLAGGAGPARAAAAPLARCLRQGGAVGESVVAAQHLTRCYGEGDTAVKALRGVSLDVAEGQLTAVMGPSGSGKSTLMHILAGLDKATSGEVTIAGTAISELNDNQLTHLRRQHIGFIFQFFNLLPMLNAEENVVLPLSLAGEKPDKEWVAELMRKMGLEERRGHRPSELSGGQQQRVAIGRALVSRPTIVFADEPTGNLDSKTSSEILALMRDSVDGYGQTTVMVTHDPRAATIADRILFLADGQIVRDLGPSTASEVIAVSEELAR